MIRSLCCYAAVTLFLFSCSVTTTREFSTLPHQLVPAEQGRIWRNGQVQLTDTAMNIYAAVKSAWQYPRKHVFTVYIENRGTNSIEFDPDKFYTSGKLANGESIGAFAFPAMYLVAVQKPPVRKIRASQDIALLLSPFWIAGSIAEVEQLMMMSPEERRAYEMQETLERIEQHQREQIEEKRRAQQYAEQLAATDQYSRTLLRKQKLKPGESADGDVAFPLISGIDSIWLIIPLSSSDTLKFLYGKP